MHDAVAVLWEKLARKEGWAENGEALRNEKLGRDWPEHDWEDAARDALGDEAMDVFLSHFTDHFMRAISLLDACEDALNLAAAKEARAYKGYGLRNITHQERAKLIKSFVAKYPEFLFG